MNETKIAPKEETIRSADGTALHCRFWRPEGEPRACLAFVHGLAEHSGRYQHVADRYAAQGYLCCGFDYRGHGRSEGARTHCDSFEEFVDDLDAFLDRVKAVRGSLPLVLVGHSHGGLIVASHVLFRGAAEGLAGVVLSSPFLGIGGEIPTIKAVAGKLLSRFMPRFAMPAAIGAHVLSHDPAVVAAYEADPLVPDTVTARWFTEVIGAQERVLKAAPRFSVPCMILQAGRDKLVDIHATRRFAVGVPPERRHYEELAGLYHEIFNEVEKEEVFERLDGWLEDLLAGREVAKASL